MPQLKGVIKTPTGEPLGGATITLTSLHNRAGILKSVFSHVTTQNGEYNFPVLPGVYSVRLTQSAQRLSEIGVIRVYEDSQDGSLNDFLGATDIDLRPEALKKFEELAQQAQQSAEKAGEHADAAEQARQDTETLAGKIQQDAEEIAGNVQKAEELASETNQNAARAEQAVKDADTIVKKAVDKLGEAATLTGEAKASAEAAAKSEQNAKQHKDEAQRIVDDLKGSNASTTEKGLVQLCSDTDNDSEELAATPKAVKTVMDETKTKAPLDSPAFTGTPTTPTPPDDAVGLEMANVAFVRKLLAALVDSSPEALDTLNELAAALGNDPNFATTIMNALAGKQPLSDVLTAISNLEERANNLLCFNQDENASLSPLSEKARSLLAQATVEAMRNELELKSAAVKDIQTDLYDSTVDRVALPGAFGYGMTDAGARSIIASDMATVARTAHNLHPGRYYTFSTQTEETTGITEIIWLDNSWGDKTSQTATKLVLFFGKDGRILMTVRGDNISAPVTWTNLTPQLGNAAQKDAQENIYDRTEGRLAIPGMFGFGKIFSSSDRTEFKSGTDFLRWVKTAKPGRYTVFADTNVVVPGIQTNGVIEIIWPQPKTSPNDEYAYKIIIYYGVNGHIYYNRCAVSSNGGYLVGWENLKVNEASLIAQIEARAPLKSPALTGTPTAPTPPDDAAGTEIANAAFVRKLLAALVGSSPEALDTLNELAAALGNDPNFATTVTKALAGKQPLNDVLTAVSQITPRKNALFYYNENGNLTLTDLTGRAKSLLGLGTYEKMRALLELKAAATMEPQSDIRDRTPGRLALSGMHGFGQAFTSTEALAFEGLSDFVEWLKKVTPGRYAVSITDSSQLLTGTTQFNGIIDVMWSPYANSESDTVRKFKTLMCYNQYYQGEHCIHYMQYRYNDSDNSWNMSSRVVVYDGDSLAYLLSRMAGSGSYYKYPAVGVPILAAYQGESFGADVSLGLGDIVPGSRLGPLAMSASVSDTGTYVSTPQVAIGGASAYNFPGRYMALSGSRSNHDTKRGYIGLFVRIE
ncbi:shikimate transporter [Escherichia coli]|uniref:prophage tail fiber N-terminal domain-containing protein n=1 Tax=Escherichia coli TaxID=562 RepID=UPI0013664798|nr:prophage tail fiber N-terminal domain-containing protein [Escherichia coli]MWM94549.1 shikimate transporter [Escherichia coli]